MSRKQNTLSREPGASRAPYPDRREGFWLNLEPGKSLSHLRFESNPCEERRPDELPNHGLFAVFSDMPDAFSHASRLFIVRSPRELVSHLEQLIAMGMIRAGRVYVQTAASESDFTDPEYEALVWNVFSGIERIKARDDKATLLRLRAALERKGVKPGPKRQEYASEWKIVTLRNLANGAHRLEDAITHPARKMALESAQQELRRYCQAFYQWCMLANLYGQEDWQKPKAAKHFREQFGLQFPRDLDAASEAYQQGKKMVEKHLTDYDRFFANHARPRLIK